ncbi:MAG TPA: hypothetical protein VKR06_01195 [Ktedonosporobacter sp.]|nr:hypothetical protein [Ktedonosporobacter sp.]
MSKSSEAPDDDFSVTIIDLPSDKTQDNVPVRQQESRRSWRLRHGVFLSLLLIQSLIFAQILQSTSHIANRFNYFGQLLTHSPITPTPQPSAQILLTDTRPFTPPDSVHIVKTTTGHVLSIIPAQAPGDCPAGPPVAGGHAIERYPLIITGFDGPHATLHLPRLRIPLPQQNWNGWQIPLQIRLATSDFKRAKMVTLSVGNLWDGIDPTFTTNRGESLSSFLYLDSLHPINTLEQPVSTHPGVWQTTLYIPASGCYYLNASWPSGRWHIIFSAGR